MVEQILSDFESAPITPALRQTLRFLEKMTLRPNELSDVDARELRAAGVSEQAARDAANIGFVFNLVTRLADAFEFDVPSSQELSRVAPRILRIGYKL